MRRAYGRKFTLLTALADMMFVKGSEWNRCGGMGADELSWEIFIYATTSV